MRKIPRMLTTAVCAPPDSGFVREYEAALLLALQSRGLLSREQTEECMRRLRKSVDGQGGRP